MTGWSVSAWVWIIFGYYFLATILPIQAIMGKVYPLFSVALIIMVVGILGSDAPGSLCGIHAVLDAHSFYGSAPGPGLLP